MKMNIGQDVHFYIYLGPKELGFLSILNKTIDRFIEPLYTLCTRMLFVGK